MPNEPQISDQDKEEKQRKEYFRLMKADYEAVFNTPEGKRVIEDLGRSCFQYQTSFSSEATEMAYNEGKRTIYLHIKGMATPEPKADKPTEAKK